MQPPSPGDTGLSELKAFWYPGSCELNPWV